MKTNHSAFAGITGLLFLLQGILLASSPVAYPGADPGAARIFREGSQIIFSNAALAVCWELGEGGLKVLSVRDVARQERIALSGGEVFEISLTNGQRYAASSFKTTTSAQETGLKPDPGAARLAERIPGRQVEASLSSADGRLRVVWRALLHDGGNYVRQEIAVSATGEDCVIREITWLNQTIPEARRVGQVDGSPVVAGSFFLASEDPQALNEALAGAPVVCRVPRNAVLKRGETLKQSFVLGVVPAGQMRRGFLHYLERERAHPYRPFLHYNSWYDIAWSPFALNETNCLEAIRLCGERFTRAHGVAMDAMVFDDGWDDPKSMWKFHRGFPNGFAPLAELCQRYQTRLGVWLSPFGGYGEPKEQRMKFGREQGYETNLTGFSLAGPKYYAAFKNACVEMIRRYGVNHFKFDGIAAGMYASGGAQYLLDTEAMRGLMLELRKEDPNLYINLTTGSWPSPFWLRYADSLWRQGNDMGHAGKGPKQQQWITYRDQEVYRNIVGKGPLFPLNSLMSQGVAYSRHGMAGESTFNSAGFQG